MTLTAPVPAPRAASEGAFECPPGINRVFNGAIPAEVKVSQRDPHRISPVLTGAALVRGDRLSVRTATREVEVQAPLALLEHVFALCDGTRTLTEVLEQAPEQHATDLRAFLPFLLDEGALVDSALLAVHASAYAHQGSPFGAVAPSRITNQLCRRFLWNAPAAPCAAPVGTQHVEETPLSRFHEARVSTYTYDERPIPEKALLQLVWSVAGVVRTRHDRVGFVAPKRTLASAGGMHLLEVFLALRRQVGRHAPGLYRVSYPTEKAVHLERLPGDIRMLPRAFSKPWELASAGGALFIAADAEAASMRYRNRAVQYLFMEAGAALHNAGLVASQLGFGFATIGGYYEDIVAGLCGLRHQMVLGSGIFGAAPTAAQVERSLQALDLEFSWVNGHSDRYAMPFHLASTRVRSPDDDRPLTWGRDADPHLAYVKAAAEAVEREGFRQPRRLCPGRLRDVPGAVDPRSIVRYSDTQYAQDSFPYAPFDENAEYCWTKATDLRSGGGAEVLAELVFSRSSIADCDPRQKPYTQVTSSGCAAGVSLEDATYRAILEVVERDAFMRHWLQQLPGDVVAFEQLPPGVQERVQSLTATGCRVKVQRLASRWANVCLVAAQNASQGFTTMGASAHPDFYAALSSALQEAEARVFAWLHGHEPEANEPEQVITPDHHFELYGDSRYYRRADRVLFPASTEHLKPPAAMTEGLPALLARMAGGGLRPLAVDITPSSASIDQGRSSLVAVKALVPGLLSMSFGFRREPMGMLEHVDPLATFPHPFP
jgi:ribosomal protein S12 methylthiotransferase accessory factor